MHLNTHHNTILLAEFRRLMQSGGCFLFNLDRIALYFFVCAGSVCHDQNTHRQLVCKHTIFMQQTACAETKKRANGEQNRAMRCFLT